MYDDDCVSSPQRSVAELMSSKKPVGAWPKLFSRLLSSAVESAGSCRSNAQRTAASHFGEPPCEPRVSCSFTLDPIASHKPLVCVHSLSSFHFFKKINLSKRHFLFFKIVIFIFINHASGTVHFVRSMLNSFLSLSLALFCKKKLITASNCESHFISSFLRSMRFHSVSSALVVIVRNHSGSLF